MSLSQSAPPADPRGQRATHGGCALSVAWGRGERSEMMSWHSLLRSCPVRHIRVIFQFYVTKCETPNPAPRAYLLEQILPKRLHAQCGKGAHGLCFQFPAFIALQSYILNHFRLELLFTLEATYCCLSNKFQCHPSYVSFYLRPPTGFVDIGELFKPLWSQGSHLKNETHASFFFHSCTKQTNA